MNPTLDWVRGLLVEKGLRSSSLNVCLAILSRCRVDDNGEVGCQISARELAEQTGLNENTVRDATRDLERHGLIRVVEQWWEEQVRLPNRYVVLDPPSRLADSA